MNCALVRLGTREERVWRVGGGVEGCCSGVCIPLIFPREQRGKHLWLVQGCTGLWFVSVQIMESCRTGNIAHNHNSYVVNGSITILGGVLEINESSDRMIVQEDHLNWPIYSISYPGYIKINASIISWNKQSCFLMYFLLLPFFYPEFSVSSWDNPLVQHDRNLGCLITVAS